MHAICTNSLIYFIVFFLYIIMERLKRRLQKSKKLRKDVYAKKLNKKDIYGFESIKIILEKT